MTREACLLVLLAYPESEDTLVDWLLSRDDIEEFTTLEARGHGREFGEYSIMEQVTGRRRQLIFHVRLDPHHAQPLLRQLREDFAGVPLHYWLMPLQDAGKLG